MGKVKFGQKKSRELKSVTCVPFVVTHRPELREIASTIKKHQNILYQDETVKRVFTPFPMVSYRNGRRLSSYLVRAKLYPLERKRGSYKCGSSRCQVCNNIDKFKSRCNNHKDSDRAFLRDEEIKQKFLLQHSLKMTITVLKKVLAFV